MQLLGRTSEVPISLTGAAVLGALLLVSPWAATVWGWVTEAGEVLQVGAVLGAVAMRAARWVRARRRSHVCFAVVA